MGLKEDMINMGFGENRTVRSLQAVQYGSMERAIAWLEAHENDPDIDDPVTESAGNVLGSAADPACAPSAAESENIPVPPTDEERAAKAAKVQAVIAERRKVTEEKDKQDAVMREKIRRKEGQSLAEMREKRQADDMRQIAEDRKREKIEDERVRKQVLENIKRDREAKFPKKTESTPTPTPVTQPPPTRDYDECKLQLRFPTGQAVVNSFKADDTLGEVVAFIRETSELDSFRLMTSFPKKQYQPTDYGFTLKSLGLCPSSVLIVSKL